MSEYKDHIEAEYKRLFEEKPQDESEQPYYHFILFGNEGCEGYKVVRSESEISCSTLRSMEIRARINGHRSIKGYAFRSHKQIPIEKISKRLINNPSVIQMF